MGQLVPGFGAATGTVYERAPKFVTVELMMRSPRVADHRLTTGRQSTQIGEIRQLVTVTVTELHSSTNCSHRNHAVL